MKASILEIDSSLLLNLNKQTLKIYVRFWFQGFPEPYFAYKTVGFYVDYGS